MFYAGRRPMGRLFYWLVAAMVTGGISVSTPTAGAGGVPAPQSGPAMTSVVDTVYRADGTPAQGILVISWPAFIAAGGTPVAAGTTNVTLGTNGALNVALVPNAGASPAGVYYVVVYQLGPGEVRTEFWLVPTTSPANLATVRTTPGSGTAAQPVSLQYVNTELATKANDNSVVHLSGPETITGTKTFSAAPSVPAPTSTSQVANKGYVDTSVANVGAGAFLPTAGGTMTGPITLPANPVSAMQAANKQYVDTGLAVKADLITGQVPAGELGTGTANSGTCLFGNGTWGACGSGGGNVSTTPAGSQAIAEPAGAVFTANRMGQKRMADQFNWKQNPTTPSALAAGSNTVTLAPCPAGFLNTINGSNSNHWIYVDSASGDAQQPGEPVQITAESCPAGANSGTITFSTGYAHGAGYALESGTGGIKEASVDANQVRYDTVRGNNTWIEVTPVATTKIKAPLYWQTSMGRLTGSSLVECSVNMSCINLGDTNSAGFGRGSTNVYTANLVDGLWLRPDQAMSFWDVAPSAPAAITAGGTSATLTIPTCPAGFWPLIPNQILWLNGTSGGLVSTAYEAEAPGPGEFVRVTGGTCTPGATNGTINIAPATPGITTFYAHDGGYTLSNGATALIEDNSQGTVISNIQTNGFVGNVGYGFVIQNDNNQAEQVTNVNMNGGLRCDSDFCGATMFGPGPNGINAGITYLSGGSNQVCAEWYDGNDLSIGPTICQGFPNFAMFLSTKRGGSLQRANMHFVHRERGGVSNSLGQNLGAADMIVQGYNVTVDGNGPGLNAFPTFTVAGNPGGQPQVYYLAIVDVTDGTKTVPIPIGQASVTNPATNNVTVKWVTADALAGKTINFELYRLLTGGSPGVIPYPGVCDGVSGDGTCLVAGSINPATVCDVHGACTFTDNVQTLGAVTPYNGIDGTGTGGYFPFNSFSPGGIVLTNSATYQGEPTCLVAASGPWLNSFASIFDNAVPPANCIPSGGSFNTVLSAFSNNAGGYAQYGLLLPDRNKFPDGGNWTGLKGRLNFVGGGSYPRDIATWRDSNPAKTMASKLEYGSGVAGTSFGTVNRPQWDVSDIATGVENNGTGLYERVPASGVHDWYVGALPNNPTGTSNNWTMELASAGLNVKVPVTIGGNLTVTSGTVALPITGAGAQCLHVSSTGVLSGTGSDCGAGSGSGTVNSGTAAQLAVYQGTGAAVSGDSGLTDNGTTLNYSGSGGVAAATGTFSGNLTVNGQLLVAGPWMVSSPIPGTAMPPASAGTSALGISNDGNFYISANGGTPLKVTTTATSSFFSDLFQEDANDVGAYNGTNPQGVDIYGTRTDASNYERLRLGYDATNNFFTVTGDYAGTGTHRGLGFNVNGSLRWVIDTGSNTFKPWSDNVQDLGASSLRVHNGYFGTGVITPSLTLSGTALSSVIGTPSSSLMTAGTVSGSGQPLCTDGTGSLTITTVGCPPGTGTLGGSGATPQFAYWTNTAGLGAAPFYLTSANLVEQYNGTNVQTFNVYGTRTDASNYERAGLAYVSADGFYELQTQQAGTGSQRGICFGVNNSCKWAVDTTTAFKPFNDNTRDIGTSSLRVRDFYLGRNLIMSGTATTYNGKTTAGTGLVPVYGAVAPTGQTAAISSTTLCATSACGAGQYEVSYYLDSTVACTTPGSAAASLTIGWTDETNAKSLQVPLGGTGISGGNSMALGSTSNFGSGAIALWSAGSAAITYSASYTGCTTGTGTYALRVAVKQVQ
jgi:hypothetical protein